MADYLTTDTELVSVANAIRTKGGTSDPLEWPQGYVDAIGAISGGGGGTEKTVEVVLTSPRNTSSALDPACILYEADSPMEQEPTPIGSISSPTGSTTVTVTKQLLLAVFQSSGYISPGFANGLYDVYALSGSVVENGQYFFVCGNGYAYVSGVDYDD